MSAACFTARISTLPRDLETDPLQEELNRLDIFHKVFLVARGDSLALDFASPPDRPMRILDLGTGTGIWSIHVTE